jgi:hypothetical protein
MPTPKADYLGLTELTSVNTARLQAYALLDALDHADVNGNGPIAVSELADYIDRKVPDFSFDTFKLRQIPQRSIVGNNVPFTNKMTILDASTVQVSGIPPINTAIPTKPTLS